MPVASRLGLLSPVITEQVRYCLQKPRRFGNFRSEADDLNGWLWKTSGLAECEAGNKLNL